jgi:hypothetical protein
MEKVQLIELFVYIGASLDVFQGPWGQKVTMLLHSMLKAAEVSFEIQICAKILPFPPTQTPHKRMPAHLFPPLLVWAHTLA